MKKTILAVLAMGALSCAFFSQQAQAAQVQGEIHMAGDVVLDSVDLSSSTAVNHWISIQNHLEKATTFGATGDFTAIPGGTEADMAHPWTFSPSTPTAPLWNVVAFGFSFDLNNIISVTKIGDNFLDVLASGTVHATGFDDTPALFSFTVNNPDGLTHLTYSFANATVAIPTTGGCPLTQGFWKTHPEAWPVNSLLLGSQTYTQAELLAILNTPVQGDASLNLAHQLIAAKLNIAAGSDPTPISSTIAHADSLLAMFPGKLPYHVAPSSAIGQMMVSDANTLDNYNNGNLTPGCSPANPATNVASSSARLNGSVNPHGLTTTVRFQYGRTTSYGSTTANQTKTGNNYQNISVNISGLSAHTTYHFRIVASNSVGTRYGSDRTFTTQ